MTRARSEKSNTVTLKRRSGGIKDAGKAARPPSLTERAYEAIRLRLIGGAYSPGGLLDINRIIDELNMSRTPVREAFLRLQNEGMVEIIPKKGIRVTPISENDLREIYQVISGLELEAVASIAYQRLGADALKPLDAALSDMQSAIKRDDHDGWARADERFHRGLLELSGNRRLERLGKAHRDSAQRAHFVALRLIPTEKKKKSIEAHRQLFEALKSGDESKVRALHLSQRQRGASMLVEVLSQHGLKVL